jgi:DNA-binding NarL/FixJ family response regulator
MPQPVAIHVFDNLMLGMNVTAGLEKLGYEVQRIDNAISLAPKAAEVKPFLIVIDLTTKMGNVNAALRAIKADPTLQHIRVLAYGDHKNESLLDSARQAGADVVTSNSAVASHLNDLVQQALA